MYNCFWYVLQSRAPKQFWETALQLLHTCILLNCDKKNTCTCLQMFCFETTNAHSVMNKRTQTHTHTHTHRERERLRERERESKRNKIVNYGRLLLHVNGLYACVRVFFKFGYLDAFEGHTIRCLLSNS